MTAGTEYNTNGAYGTVKSLEDATVHVLAELDPAEDPVTIGGAEYKQFVQASTAANSDGAIPGNGTATYVFSPKVDCSVTLHSRATSKVWYFLESPDGANVTNTATDSTVADVMTFNLRAGRTYYYYCQGSKPMVYGIYFDAPVADADSLLKEGTRKDDPSAPAQSAEAKSVKLSWTAVKNDTDVFYGVDTYVDGVKVDMVDGITDTNTIINRLSSGVKYTFKVYVSEKGDSANSLKAENNKTLIGETEFTTEGTKDTAAITAPEGTSVSLASAIYTCAQGTWTGISKDDARVRGYKIYANGNLVKTLYNYQIKNYASVDKMSNQVGRLTPGIDNKVQVVAFTDAGVEYKYPEATVKTLQNYDYKAPVWGSDAKVTAKETKDGDLEITWDAATDDTAVGGYRVYVDGTAYGSEKYFNPVNGAKTTTETTYTIKKSELPEGFDMTKAHTITIQAGDTWWKAGNNNGSIRQDGWFQLDK